MNTDTLPTTLANGSVVMERHALPNSEGLKTAEIVLCHLPHNDATPYATWQRNTEEGNGGTYWGHYFSDEAEARGDYAARVARKS